MLPMAINHMSAPRMEWRSLLDTAKTLNCIGVEFRNDLDTPLFSGERPEVVAEEAAARGLRIVGLSQVYPFNAWSEAIHTEVQALIATARACGAETVSLIPRNDGTQTGDDERQANLRLALREIRPLLQEAKMTALIEPLGFSRSSLRSKAETIEAIEAVASRDQFRIVHDTFHHFLAGGGEVFADWTGIIHVSGVTDQSLAPDQMEDVHRVLVDADDRLGNVAQVSELCAAGFAGPISMEAFAPQIHALDDLQDTLATSFQFIRSELAALAVGQSD
jgi:2-keto-myo-inositol isomerase